MSRSYHCKVCGAQGHTDNQKAPCIHGFKHQEMGFERRSRPSKLAKTAVWNQPVGVTKTPVFTFRDPRTVKEQKCIKVKKKRVKGTKGTAPELMSPYAASKANSKPGRKTCVVCGSVNTSPHHVIPRSEGGLPIFDNIVWLCQVHHDEVEGPAEGAWQRINTAIASYTPTP